jgi:hypothetical protein
LRKIPCSHPVLHRRIAHLMKTSVPAILLLFPILLLSCASGHHEPFAGNPPIARDLDALETQEARILKGLFASQEYALFILRTRDGLIDAPRWELKYMRLTGQLSLTNYLRLEHSREVYTIETPTHLSMEDRLRMHVLK